MIFPRELKDRRVLVVGLGKSGIGAVRLALREGARVTAFDERPFESISGSSQGAAVASLVERGVEFFCGARDFERRVELFRAAELVVVSPGFPLARPEIAAARQAGAQVVGEIELASWFLDKGATVIGISGTNGKSTVTSLTGALCAASGRATFTGGNLGDPLSEAIVRGDAIDFAVLELSSFQLEGIESLRPKVACLTNLTPDHLDRYADHAAYGAAKKRIFRNQDESDFGVVNARDEGVLALIEGERCRRFTFGMGAAVDRAARFDAGMISLRLDSGSGEETYRLANANLRGPHNAENAMAAILCARLSGVSPEAVQSGLDSYPGLAHRLEIVGEVDGVEFVNDSKATNIDSTIVALRSFERGVFLIAGGRGKGLPYAPLAELARGRVECVLTIGEDASLIEKACDGIVPTIGCGDLETAMRTAFERARPGDVVLLSPACASYDQFANFEVRGETFRAIAQALGKERRGGGR